jgi:hypothetical protein
MIWAAFTLGLAGSLHCVGMCGPLAMLIHGGGLNLRSNTRQLLYHTGRIGTYLLVGLVVGAIGEYLVIQSVQKWLTLIIGSYLILYVLFQYLQFKNHRFFPAKLYSRWKKLMARNLKKDSIISAFLFGTLNGFIPCGLVYLAAIAAFSFVSIENSILFMLFFGLGTIPLLFFAPVLLHRLTHLLPVRTITFQGILIVASGSLLLFRGFQQQSVEGLANGWVQDVISACGF